MTNKMDIDEALLEVGGMRPYHWLLFCLINLALTVPIAVNTMLYIFIGWTPGHHCKPGPDETQSNSSHVYQFNASLPQCHLPVDDNTTVPCQYGWIYDVDLEKENSVVTEWDLVCEHNYQSELAETLSSLGAILGLLFLAPLVDKFGRKPIFLFTLFVYTVLGTALSFAPSLTVYKIIRFFGSFTVDVSTYAAFTLMMELYSTKHRSFAGVGAQFIWVFAYFYIAMLQYIFRAWRIFLLVAALPWSAFLVLYWLVPESPLWLVSMNRQKEACKSLKFLAKRNCVSWTPPDELIFTEEGEEDDLSFIKQLMLLFKDPVLRKHIFMSCLYWLTNNLVYLGIMVSMPSLAGNKYLSFTLSGVVELPAYILCFFLVPYTRRITTIVFHFMAGVSMFAAALVIGMDVGGEHQNSIMLAITLLGKFSITASYTVIIVYTIELFPTNLRGAGASYGGICARIGAIGSPFIAYWMKYNEWLPLLVMGLLATVAGLATFVLPETCDKKLPLNLEDVYKLYKKKNVPVSTEDKDNNDSYL